MPAITRALISVSDKRGLAEFARALTGLHVEIISTGGTAQFLRENGIPVRQVDEITGFPEILDGRVKTLHPRIHAALLAITNNERHMQQLREHSIDPIDMVVVNLYPFEQTVARNGVTFEEAVEQIDIGGPTMIRAAAKNFKHKAVVINPERYGSILDELRLNGNVLSEATSFALAREVFNHVAVYDGAISEYFNARDPLPSSMPATLTISLRKEMDLRYGENPHQGAALYGNFHEAFQHIHGKELSYNNIVDIVSAAALVAEFDEPAVAIIKHTNPCGMGTGPTLREAYEKALATDTKSAFGGIVAVNRTLDIAAAQKINEIFTEVVIAPEFAPDVLDLLKKKKDRRLMKQHAAPRQQLNIKSIAGGLLVQEPDERQTTADDLNVVTKRSPTGSEMKALLFAWRVAKHVKSNAIVYTLADRTIGIGAGQMSRVDSARIAAMKADDAGLSVRGSAVASDAFFPFADGLLEAVRAGSTAVIQPGGSIRDEEVIKAADDNDIAMVFTGSRHFKH